VGSAGAVHDFIRKSASSDLTTGNHRAGITGWLRGKIIPVGMNDDGMFLGSGTEVLEFL